jgi:hypothetical protein
VTITQRFYDDVLDDASCPQSIFLAGPTAQAVRTAWRQDAVALLDARGFAGTVIIPEFRDGRFEEHVERRFGSPASTVPGMRAASCNILKWETTGIESATIVLFWMPFALAAQGSAASLPGFTTRAEVSRELARDPSRIVLGMPPVAISGGHIRFHAHHAGVAIAETLEATVDAALTRVRQSP